MNLLTLADAQELCARLLRSSSLRVNRVHIGGGSPHKQDEHRCQYDREERRAQPGVVEAGTLTDYPEIPDDEWEQNRRCEQPPCHDAARPGASEYRHKAGIAPSGEETHAEGEKSGRRRPRDSRVPGNRV